MPKQPSQAANAAVARAPTTDKLERVRDAIREARDLQRRREDLEDQLSETKARIFKIERESLPTLFSEVGLTTLGLEAEGNLPAYECEKKPYVRANISAEWEPERRAAAFAYLDQLKAGDMIRTTITVYLGRDERALAKKVVAAIKKLGVQPEIGMAVPWNTLTAWLRERISKNTTPKLDVIGGEVGEIVVLKPVKTGD